MDKGLRLSKTMASSRKTSSVNNASGGNVYSVDFEVFGKVQGVFFRKYTQAQGATLNLRGWCQNTSRGTVIGQLEGGRDRLEEMKRWLKTEGSPKSKITQCIFSNEQKIEKYSFNDFTIRK